MIEIKKHIATGFGKGELYDVLMQLQNMALLTAGKVYYVSKTGNSTDGLSWANAFSTIAAAIAASNATIDWSGNEEDNYIVIAPGTYAESLTTSPYYCHLIGLGVRTLASSGMKVKIEPASGVCMSGTALGLHLYNLCFKVLGAVDALDFGICNDVLVENCLIEPGADANVNAFSTTNSDGLRFINNKIKSGLGSGGFAYGLYFAGGADKYLHNALIQNNIIGGLDAAGTGIYIASDCTGTESVIDGNIIKLSGAGVGIDDDSDDVVVTNNIVFHSSGDAYDINASLAAKNIDNNNGTVTDEPNMG
ncbi:MAG: right-handed parallel beta-helix repeat-containing protein [Candidatus Bipolaricaulis sp.]|nr:right-handed parallel beta-helix repeat-containing protein [Candidatus Bipolaricaulis sp.]